MGDTRTKRVLRFLFPFYESWAYEVIDALHGFIRWLSPPTPPETLDDLLARYSGWGGSAYVTQVGGLTFSTDPRHGKIVTED